MNIFNLFKKQTKAKAPKGHYIVMNPKNYAAANNNNMTYSWANYKYTSDQIIEKYAEKLVAKSCEQYMNNPYFKNFIRLLKDNVIGDMGIRPQAQSKDANGKLDDIANQALEDGWGAWSRVCDITGKMNLTGLFKLLISTCAREGEGLLRIVVGKDAGPWGFGLQLIDPRRLDFHKNDILDNGNYIRFGIEFNKYGKPVNYYIKKYDDDWRNFAYTNEPYDIIPADEIIHGFIPEYVDQKRGIPWSATALMRMYMLNGFEEAAVEHARAGACQMGFITSPGDPESDDEDDDTPVDMDIEATPATFKELPPGYDIKKFDPNYPNGEFDTFTKACLRGIAVGFGASYSSVSGDISSVNFSSLRQGILDEREVWKGLQEWFIATFANPIFENWLKYSLLFSKIKCGNGYLKPERIEKYRNITWSVRRWSWVDPVKDINSASIAVKNGFRSRSDVIRELGRDPEDVWNEVEEENNVLRTKGILTENEVIKDVGKEEDNEENAK